MSIWNEIEETCSKNKSLDNYMSVIKARQSKLSLYLSLKRYYTWSKAKSYDDLLQGSRPELEDKIISYIKFLNPQVTRSIIQHLFYAVRTFYTLNDVILNWGKLKRFKDPQGTKIKDRPYTKAEIEMMLAKAKASGDMLLELAILILASSGMRIGALTVDSMDTALELEPKKMAILRLKDLKWIEEHRLFGLRIYAGHDEEYETFVSPQASQQIIASFRYRERRLKEKLTKGSYLLWNKTHPELPLPMKTLQRKLIDCAKAVGIRNKGVVKAAHGFRKYVDTVAFVESGLEPRKKELMLGHRLAGEENSYYKPTTQELLVGNPEAKGYIYALSALTFKY